MHKKIEKIYVKMAHKSVDKNFKRGREKITVAIVTCHTTPVFLSFHLG